MGNLFTRLSSFLFILIGRQPQQREEAQRIRAGSACSAADSEWAWLFIILIMRQPNSEKKRIAFELACLQRSEIILPGTSDFIFHSFL